jgi:hypothetical protein
MERVPLIVSIMELAVSVELFLGRLVWLWPASAREFLMSACLVPSVF